MFRIRSYLTFLLLLAVESESFSAARNPHGRPQITNSRSLEYPLSSLPVTTSKRKRPSSSSAAFLSSAEFQPGEGMPVNNRHSAKDWGYNILTLPSSRVLRDIRNPVLSVFGWGTAISLLHHLLVRSGQTVFQSLAHKLCLSSAAHSYVVSSLGLLLVFRTNSAYQRFYEGRKIWEEILSTSRNLSRLASLYSRDIGPARRKRIRNLIAAYPYLLRHHIRTGCLCENDDVDPAHRLRLQEPALQMIQTRHEGDKRCGGTTKPEEFVQVPPRECFVDRRKLPWSLLTPGALAKVASAKNRPLWICDRLGREIVDIPYGNNFSNRERQHFLTSVEKLTDAIGKCERIHQTAVPLNYARHSLRALTLWLFTLPFTLVKDMGFMTGPAAGAISWAMFGIFQIGVSIEDPFRGSLRLSVLCDDIRSDVMGSEDMEEADARDTAYTIEQASGIDDASNTIPLMPQEILIGNGTHSSLRLISLSEYKTLERVTP